MLLRLSFGLKGLLDVQHARGDAFMAQHALNLRDWCTGLGVEGSECGSEAVLGQVAEV